MLRLVTAGAAAALLAFVIAVATGALWFRRVYAVRLPENRSGFVAAMTAAVALGVAALALGAGWGGGLLAGLAIVAGLVFDTLVAISAQKGGPGAFRLGAPVPDFAAPDDDGRTFALSSLAGRPLLLKFFRGHW